MEEGAWSPHYTIPSFKLAEGPSSQHSMRGEAGHQTPSWAHRELGPWKIRLAPPRTESYHTPGLSEVSCVLPRRVMPGPTRGIKEEVRPVSPGSEGQNWRTAPPLASGHLNEC